MLKAGVKVTHLDRPHHDVATATCFACMRILQTLNKHRTGGKIELTTKQLVQLATIDGARDLGFADVIGSLTPGKRADLILVRTDATNMAPVGDPYDALVQLGAAVQCRHRRRRRPHPAPQRPVHRARS